MNIIMKIVPIFAIVSSVIPTAAFAYQEANFNGPSPNSLAPGTSVFSIAHGFETHIVEGNTLVSDLDQKKFGLSGANIEITGAYIIDNHIDIHVTGGLNAPEITVGGAYTLQLKQLHPFLGTDAVIQRDDNQYQNSFFSWAGAGTNLFEKWHVVPAASLGYDSYNKNLGASISVALPFEDNAFVAEVIPHFTNEPLNFLLQNGPAWNFGYRHSTFGHKFFLLIANSSAVNYRQAMLGSANSDLHLAFRITREY
jgi:hypothetical protein